MKKHNLSPCSHCRSKNPGFSYKQGRVGITRTAYYRETVKCGNCKIEVSAGTPGNAVAFWNRSFQVLQRDINREQVLHD